MANHQSASLAQLPTLDEIGAEIHCWRKRRERDRDYADRLALHLEARIIEFENLLTACLAIKVNPNVREPTHDNHA